MAEESVNTSSPTLIFVGTEENLLEEGISDLKKEAVDPSSYSLTPIRPLGYFRPLGWSS